ncbi:MAG: antibiotic transport system permease protein [Candidatus Saganbacteria bacterium]|uniref:Transport permease protein n=1 Tax=Candidatus Saganbacteria bacterium TaxID=2575572 RepID=A0A833NSU8_UNCSA|nr:MAG: antibiotic transport system permease protein [Candidatus Saganbacteria bacterium]
MSDILAIYVLWLRDIKHYWYDKIRIFASLGQPLLILFVLGTALTPTLQGGVSFSKYIFPGVISMTVLFTSIFSAISIVWDREFGFLKEVLVAPISRWSIVAGKALGGSTVAVMQGAIMLFMAPLVGVELNLLIIVKSILAMFIIALAMNSLGIVIAARMKEMEGFQMVVNFIIMPLFFLSGALFPTDKLPQWLLLLNRFDPLTYGVDLLRKTIIGISNFHSIINIGVLLVFTLIMFSIAVFEFNISE